MMIKKSLFLTLLLLILVTVIGAAACSLKPEDGKSAYDLYVEKYIELKGSLDGVLTESEWLLSLKGEDGKSAHDLYKEAYIKALGTEDGILSEEDWLASLKGDTGVSISHIEIYCGDIIIYYNNDTSETLEYMLADAGHSWGEGVTTTNPTCITPGIKTYTCENCGATKKELLDSNGEHNWGEYDYDSDYHWRTCKICGETETHEHNFDEGISKDNVDAILKCECGIHQTVGEFYSFKVVFECGDGASVLIYDTQDYTVEGAALNIAYARSKNGELLNDGEGQVNFEVSIALGYKLKQITVTPATGYKNFKGEEDTGVYNIYRITKITCGLTVTIETEIDTLNLPVMVINTANHAHILDKENYVDCTVSVLNAEEYNLDTVSAEIRLRGNTTSGYPKKPYRIKFDKKQDLFGFGDYKSWVLLALYQDFSSIKDFAAFKFAHSISNEQSAFVPKSKHVEVYLNGQYIGLYLLTEQVQENQGRVGIEEKFDETLTEVPFLVEWDEYAPSEGTEDVDWFKIFNADSGVTSYYNVKYPEVDQRYSQEQFDFIKNYIINVNSLCHNPIVTIEQFEEFIDLPTFIDYYLIQEFMGQGEINWKSIYMSRSINGQLVMGPIWDFDWSATGPVSYGSTWGYEGWSSTTNWFAYMLNVNWFFDKVCERWTEIKDTLATEIDNLRTYKIAITAVSERNAILWDFIDDGNPENDFDGYYDKVIRFFENRLNWIDNQLT